MDTPLNPACPDADKTCRTNDYLVLGDIVMTGPEHGSYTCAGYVDRRGVATIWWLPTRDVRPLHDGGASVDWVGRWWMLEHQIDITKKAAALLHVEGHATWGSLDPERVKRGAVHTGDVAGDARPADGEIAFAVGPNEETLPYDTHENDLCRIKLWRRGPYLLASDNLKCGGVNVSFSGLYRKGH